MACRMRRMPRRRSSSAAEYSPMCVSSGSSASASRRSTVSGVRSRCDRSATISRSLVREVISRSAIRLNAYPASASSRGPDGWMRTPRSPSPTAIAACTRLRADDDRAAGQPVHHDHRADDQAQRDAEQDPPVARGALVQGAVRHEDLDHGGARRRPVTGCSRTTPPSTSTTAASVPSAASAMSPDAARRPVGAAGGVHHAGRRRPRSIAALQAAAAGAGGQRAGHRGALLLGGGHGLVAVVGTQLPAERDEEREGGDRGDGGADVGQPRPQSGATNRNPTPRTVRR